MGIIDKILGGRCRNCHHVHNDRYTSLERAPSSSDLTFDAQRREFHDPSYVIDFLETISNNFIPMRPFSPQYIQNLNQTFQSTAKRHFKSIPLARMSSTTDKGELKIENTNINTKLDVDLREHKKLLVGSVLDLFAGRPSLAKLQLWKDDATFTDSFTIAQGREQYEAQWYGLQSAFEEIERLSHEVTSAGNPIEMDLKQRYKVKGIGKETTVTSKVNIFLEGDYISRVEDKWWVFFLKFTPSLRRRWIIC